MTTPSTSSPPAAATAFQHSPPTRPRRSSGGSFASTALFGFVPWITSLLDNHYHTIGYLRVGENLGPMMQWLHGSVSKLINDLLRVRRVPFFRSEQHHDYFDGCLRDVVQGIRACRYVLDQSVRHGIVKSARLYPHTIVDVHPVRAIRRAVELKAFTDDLPYARYAGYRAKRRQQRRGCFSNPDGHSKR